MSKVKRGNIRIPEEPSDGPSILAIIILFAIPEIITKVIGGFLLVKRIKNETLRKRYHLYRRYAGAIGDRTTDSIRELASTLGMATANVASDLQAMIDEGVIIGNAYIDRSHMTLHMDKLSAEAEDLFSQIVNVFVSPEDRAKTVAAAKAAKRGKAEVIETGFVSEKENDAPKAEKKKQDEPAASASDSDNCEAKLREIRQLNDAIEDPTVSERIDRIGEITASIFRVVREKPEHAEEVRRFMNYYLPTTLKLLKSYSLMEKQSYQGENIQSSRKKIEQVLNTLVKAFEQQQDRLFRTEAMDVDADISVLNTMMASDGLIHGEQGELRVSGSGLGK